MCVKAARAFHAGFTARSRTELPGALAGPATLNRTEDSAAIVGRWSPSVRSTGKDIATVVDAPMHAPYSRWAICGAEQGHRGGAVKREECVLTPGAKEVVRGRS